VETPPVYSNGKKGNSTPIGKRDLLFKFGGKRVSLARQVLRKKESLPQLIRGNENPSERGRMKVKSTGRNGRRLKCQRERIRSQNPILGRGGKGREKGILDPGGKWGVRGNS